MNNNEVWSILIHNLINIKKYIYFNRRIFNGFVNINRQEIEQEILLYLFKNIQNEKIQVDELGYIVYLNTIVHNAMINIRKKYYKHIEYEESRGDIIC